MAIENRYEFVMLFDVEFGNPNGDPDAGNMPRVDPETSHGIVTDVCLKRKIRDYVDLVREENPRFQIYVRNGVILNAQHERAYKALDLKPVEKQLPKEEEEARKVTEFMCENFYDIRTFGAVMTTKVNCGQVRGPVQMNFAQSVDPIVPQGITITRVAITSKEDAEKKRQEMGRKHVIPYALYRIEGYVSASLAQKTGFDEEDIDLLWEALKNLFEHDHSAARGKMATRRLFVFKHNSMLGCAPSHVLFDMIKVSKKNPVNPARSFTDYVVSIQKDKIPEGVILNEMI